VGSGGEDPKTRFRRVEAGPVVRGRGAVTLEPDQTDSAFCDEGMLSTMQNMGKAATPEGVLGKPCIAAQTKRVCIIIGPTEDCLVELDARVGLLVDEGSQVG